MAQESMTVWETAEAARQQQHWRWWLEEDTQSIPYTDTSHSYLISKRARRQESSSYSIRRRRGLYDKLFWCTMEKRIVEELMTSQKDSQSSSSDRIKKKKSQSWRVELGKFYFDDAESLHIWHYIEFIEIFKHSESLGCAKRIFFQPSVFGL